MAESSTSYKSSEKVEHVLRNCSEIAWCKDTWALLVRLQQVQATRTTYDDKMRCLASEEEQLVSQLFGVINAAQAEGRIA